MSEDDSQPQGATAIAIVGMAGRFPGAPTLERFWENLRDGVESVSFFTEEELLAAGVEPSLLTDPAYVRARAIFDGIEDFDAAFFGFTPREAEVMDPQHRVLLECAWEALEDAGQDPDRASARAAVYAGSGTCSYLFSNLMPNAGLLATVGGLQALLLNDRDFLATRLSYKLNLKGPSVLVQTACSTGLTAVHMASQSLLSGESDLALAGAVSIALPEKEGYLYQEGAITSPDGHCRAFDASSGGAVVGNGCGVVVLKRLADAMADGDSIYAVIRGSAVNNDGSGKVGFTAPSVEGQAEVITESLLMAGVEPGSIAYVEGHGSGTALGDPIEVAALRQAFAAAGGTDSCALGSVKTNVGHLNTAAGLAGLIKTALALKHATIPPSLHFERPNPQCDFGPFTVPTQAQPWPADLTPRRAGVSSFGLGGTNVHAVLEEAPSIEAGSPSRASQLLTVSARTEPALDAACRRLADRLETGTLDLADVAFTLQTGRKAFACRRAVVARDRAEAVAALREGRGSRGAFEGSERPVVFLFPGLGDQAPGMGRELYETEPVFAAEIDRCAEILGMDLREMLFAALASGPERPADVFSRLRSDAAPLDEAGQRLARTENAQPAVFAVEYALARLLMSWGVVPRAMIGYSLGEYVAATLAGVLSLENALGLVARRAKLIQGLPGGAMLAVPQPEAEVSPLLGGELSLAATNGPHFCVVAGPEGEVGELESRLSGRGVACLRLTTTHAFHSRMMAPAVAPLTAIARALPVAAPAIPYVSNVTGTWITAADLADPGYWGRHMTQAVRFAEGLAELLHEPDQVALEVGPGGTLTTLVHQAAGTAAATATTLGRTGEGGEQGLLLEALGRLWAAGARFDSAALYAGERRRKVRLPTYPFERQRYWIDPPAPGAPVAESAPRADVADWFWTPSWKQMPLPAMASPEDDGGWLIFLDETGLGERIAERLRGEGRTVAMARQEPSPDYAALLKSGPAHVVHLWGVTAGEPSSREAQEAGLLSLVRLAQASGDLRHVTVVANGLHEVMDGDAVHPAKATVLGALKVIPQESAGLSCACIDIGQLSDRLIDQILAEARLGATAGGSAVALRGRQRWVRDFAPVPLPAPASCLPGGAYLVTGGQHGAALANFLVSKLEARVAMVGEARPGVISLAAAEPAAVLAAAQAALGKIDGVFHTVGAFTGGLVQLKTAESLLASIEPAMQNAEAWLAAVDSSPEAPGFVLLMSSTLAFTGGLGQLDLAATGSFLDALAQHQAATGGTRTLVAHWDPYQWHGWLVAAAGGLAGLQPGEVEQSLDAWGIPAEKSGDALLRLLASGLPRAVISSRPVHGLIAEADAVTAETFLAQVGGLHTGTGEKMPRPALSTPYAAPRNEREEVLVTLWQELFGIAPLGVDDSFLELGGHSLLAIQMVTQIRNRFAADLPVTALFESPTVAKLAKAVARVKGEESEEDLAALLALVEGLSPEEATEKLAGMETVP